MIYTDRIVKASGPTTNVALAAIGMSPQKWELVDGRPFTGPSGRIFNDALLDSKVHRASVYVTNLCNFFIDDNNLYSVPLEIMAQQRARCFAELDAIKPNCLAIMGADTLDLLTASGIAQRVSRKTGRPELYTIGARQGITKWRGSIFQLKLPSGRLQKCVAMMHPAGFIRGQWKWLPVFRYIDVPRAVTQSRFSEMNLSPRISITSPSFQTAHDYLREAQQKEWISIDYEGRKHITCLGVGWDTSEAICIPLSRVGSPTYWSSSQELRIWQLWTALLQNPKVKKIAQNAPFEWIKSWLYGIHPNPLGLCTMLAHHCLYPDFGGSASEWQRQKRSIDSPGHGLAFLTSQYTDQPFYKDDGRHWTPELGEEAFWRYNALDVMVTYEIAMKEISELQKAGLWDAYQREYLDVFEPALRMEWFGTAFDTARRDVVRLELRAELAKLGGELEEATGYSKIVTKAEVKGKNPEGVLNLGSPKQMQHFLYKERGHRPHRHHKTQKITTDKDTLNELAIKDPVLQHIIKMKQIQDLINDVIDVRLDSQGFIHCHNKLGGTNGTRWSSTESILDSGTNLQNIPVQGVARSLFLP